MPNTSGVELSGKSLPSRVHGSPARRDLSTNSGRVHGESGETRPKPQSQREIPAKPTRDKSCKLRYEVPADHQCNENDFLKWRASFELGCRARTTWQFAF